MEVVQHIGDYTVRCVMLGASEGLCRDMEVQATGAPICVPVGEAVLGRLLNVLGEPIDGGGNHGFCNRGITTCNRSRAGIKVDVAARDGIGDVGFAGHRQCRPRQQRGQHTAHQQNAQDLFAPFHVFRLLFYVFGLVTDFVGS